MSLSGGSKKSTTSATSQTNPWAPTIPYLNDFLTNIGKDSQGIGKITPNQTADFNQLRRNSDLTGTFADNQTKLAGDMYGDQSNSGKVDDAFSVLKSQLGGYANGGSLDVGSNPYIQGLLNTVRSDVSNQVNSQWGAGGRDFSPGHAMALGRGITNAEAPILLDQYNRERAAQSDASKTLFGAGTGSAVTGQQLNEQALTTRAGAAGAVSGAQDMTNYGPNARLNLEEQIKGLPLQEMGWLAQYLFPAAQLGQQSQGTSNTKSSSAGWGLTPQGIGQGIGLIGAFL
jgi:hypothetical protein